MHVEFYVDLPSDWKPSLLEWALGEQSQSGINLFLRSDQVRFYRNRKEVALDDVPAIVYSEVMRDIDLFTSVTAVGPDESWFDQGDRGMGILPLPMNMAPVSQLAALRLDVLSRVLPLTGVADRCKVDKAWLVVRGQLGTYHIDVLWGLALQVSDSGTRHITFPKNYSIRFPWQPFPLSLITGLR